MTEYTVRVTTSPLVKVEATNLFLAVAEAVKQTGAHNIQTIVVKLHGVKLGPTTFDSSNFQRLADELFRLSPLAEGFEVEETNCEGDNFYFIDPESHVLKVTLDGKVEVES